MIPIIFQTQFNESGTRVYFMRLGRLYRFKTENDDLEYLSTTSVCIDQEIKYFSLNESLGILFVIPRPTRSVGSQRMRTSTLPSTIVRFDLRSKELIDSRSYGGKDIRRISMNRNYIAIVFRKHIKIYHAYNFKESLQKFETSNNPEGVVALALKRDVLAFPTPGPPGAMTVLKLGGSYLRKQEWARVIRTSEREKWLYAKLSRNGNYLGLVSTRGTPVRVIEIRNQNQIYEFKIKNPQKRICELEFSPSNKYLAVLCPTSLFIFRISKLLEPKKASSPVASRKKSLEGEKEEKEGEEEDDDSNIERKDDQPPPKSPEPKRKTRSSGTSMFLSLFGGGGKKSLVGKYNFKSGQFPVSVRFSKDDNSVVMVSTKRGYWIEMKFEYEMTAREKRKHGYPVDGPVRVSERTIEDSMSGEQMYLSNLGIIAKEKSDENEFVLQCIARRDTPDPAPQIRPTEVIVNQNTGQTVRWLSNIIRVRLSSTQGNNAVGDEKNGLNDSSGVSSGWGSDDSDDDDSFAKDESDDSTDSEFEEIDDSNEEEGEFDSDDLDLDDDDDISSEEYLDNIDDDDTRRRERRRKRLRRKKRRNRKKGGNRNKGKRKGRKGGGRGTRKKKIFLFVNGELQDGDEELYRLFQKYRTIQHPSTVNSFGSDSSGSKTKSLKEIEFASTNVSPSSPTEFQEEEEDEEEVVIPDDVENELRPPSVGMDQGSAPFGTTLSASPYSTDGGTQSDDEFGRVLDLPENVVAMKRNRILRVYYSYVHQPTSFVHVSNSQKMPIKISRHSANLIDSEKGYLFGGVNLSRGKFRLSSHLYSVEFMEGRVMDFSKVHLGLYGTTAPVRYSHSSFYDPEERNLYVFGGSDDRVFSGELFVFSLSKKKWDRVECKGTLPFARIDSAVVFRRRCRKAILWGGFIGSLRRGEYCNDLYELDLEHLRWNKFFRLSNDLIPVGRSKHFMRLYNDEQMMLLHGGFHDFQPCYDTWRYDFGNHEWRRLSIMAPFPNPLSCVIFRKYMVSVSEDLSKVHIFNLRDRCWKRVYIVRSDDIAARKKKKSSKLKRKGGDLERNNGDDNDDEGKVLSMASSLTNNRNIIYIFGGETKERKSVDSYYIIDFSHYNFD